MYGKDKDEDEKMAAVMKKYTQAFAALTPAQKKKLKEHAIHHTPQHMQMMIDLMEKGMSFDDAHDRAMRKFPSPKKEMKGMMIYDEKEASFYMRRRAGMKKKEAGYGKKEEKEALVDNNKVAGCDCGLMTASMCASKGGTPTASHTCKVYAYHSNKKKDMKSYKEGYMKEEEDKEAYVKKPMMSQEVVYASFDGVILTAEMTVGANSKSVVLIEGIAFHSGLNKNNWELGPDAAQSVASQMKGTDLTLNHPKTTGVGFGRNMTGGVDESVVGIVTEAEYIDLPDGEWIVRYRAEVHRSELFEALESGMWLRPGYGVSIGGYGVPDSLDSSTGIAKFNSDFTLDHLAIVHKPAYERATIESVRRIEKEGKMKATFISHSDGGADNQEVVSAMTEETVIDNTELEAEIESLKADLVLASSRVAEFESAEADRVEAERVALVETASEKGMSGHEDLKADTIRSLIASWDEAHPEPAPVVMEPVESEPAAETPAVASESSVPVVANYLNGKIVETDERVYAKAWNAWAKAWNGTLSIDEREKMSAPNYEDMKEMI